MSYPIEQIASLIGAKRAGHVETNINWLITDSRSLSFPEETLFFALNTKRGNGNDSIPELYSRGVRNFVVEENIQKKTKKIDAALYPNSNFLVVNDSLKALQRLAEQHRSRFNIPVVGITGSNGKTIVKEWLYHLLSPDFSLVRSPRSYNSQVGVPLSVWQLKEDSQLGIFEAGISEMGEMRILQNMIKPTIGILTSIGSAHSENFASIQEKCMEKLILLKDCDVVIYNGDNTVIANCVTRSLLTAREIAWSRIDAEKPLFISSVKREASHTEISYRYLGMGNTFRIPFVDEASVENAINCLAVCLYMMLPAERINERMAHLEPIAMRLEVKEGKNNCVIINDSYNSDLTSLELALNFLVQRSAKDKKLKRTLILSDILESGQNPLMLYRKIGQILHDHRIDKLIGVGNDISLSSSRFEMEKYFFPDTDALIQSGVLQTLHDEVVLIKGGRNFKFEFVFNELEAKAYDTSLEVDLKGLIDNLNYYRSKLAPGVKTVCMVKAEAYGAGAVEVSRALQDNGVNYLGVAVIEEGIELREAGITIPIMVMNPDITALKSLIKYGLEPEIYNFRILDALIHETEREGVVNYPIHVKIDTGMHRLGFEAKDVPALINRLKSQTAVIPRSIFSHLAGSEETEFDDFTNHQISLFDQTATEFQAAFAHRILKHLSNSAGIERFPQAQFDMIRLGIGLYGVNPITNTLLHNVGTLKTTIMQIRDVAPGETIGYSRRGKITKDSRIAVIRIGYADGLNRHLGNRNFYCIVNGQKADYVGNVCMDVCMIDVTGIDCKEGDKAIVFGNELPVTLVANQLGTISYEVMTSVSARVKRIYNNING